MNTPITVTPEENFADILAEYGKLCLLNADAVLKRYRSRGYRYDRRRKYYLILDCETSTLAYAQKFPEAVRKNVAISMPLIYDIGWQIIDCHGRVYARKSYLVNEIFNNLEIFNTGYYAWKRPMYAEALAEGKITLASWESIIADLMVDMSEVEAVGAYNAKFDFHTAIPFTENYFAQTKLPTAQEWLRRQYYRADKLAYPDKEAEKAYRAAQRQRERAMPPEEKSAYYAAKARKKRTFTLRGMEFPMFDLWGMTVTRLLDTDHYRQTCLEKGWKTESGTFFPTNAEAAFRYISGLSEFEESHTALADTVIESVLFAMIYKADKTAWTEGIIYNPHQKLGKVQKYLEVLATDPNCPDCLTAIIAQALGE